MLCVYSNGVGRLAEVWKCDRLPHEDVHGFAVLCPMVVKSMDLGITPWPRIELESKTTSIDGNEAGIVVPKRFVDACVASCRSLLRPARNP
jgi:hypothetical protein